MICDLAETYHIFNYRELPVKLLATLVAGLRADSRTKMEINGTQVSHDTLLMAMIYDKLSQWIWAHSKDGRKGIHPPKSLTKALSKPKEPENQSYEDGESFDKAYQRIINGGKQ